MAVIAGAIAALGTIVSAYAAYQSGQQQAKALDYQAKVARNQATAAQQAAQGEAGIGYGGEVRARGLESAERLRRFEAGASRRAGTLGAGASLLQGAGTVYGIYRGAQTPPSTQAPYTTTGGT